MCECEERSDELLTDAFVCCNVSAANSATASYVIVVNTSSFATHFSCRRMLEDSVATKCPNLGYHLAGTKKVQQELAREGVIDMFLENAEEARSVSSGERVRVAYTECRRRSPVYTYVHEVAASVRPHRRF